MAKKEGTLRIVGVGWSRTGTNTLQLTLNSLGLGPTFHGFDLRKNNRRLMKWIIQNCDNLITSLNNNCNDKDCHNNTRNVVNWDEFFDGYNAACDSLCYMFWKQIIEYYESKDNNNKLELKVILTKRDPNKWLLSLQNSIDTIFYPKKYQIGKRIIPYLFPTIGKFFHVTKRLKSAAFGYDKNAVKIMPSANQNGQLYIDIFNKHNNDIVKYFKNKYGDNDWKKHLFIIDWETKDQTEMFVQFCHFLGLSKQDALNHLKKNNNQGFQRHNSTQSMVALYRKSMIQKVVLPCIVVFILILVIINM